MDKSSKDEAHGIMCVSGAVFEPERFKVFSRLWNRMLDRVGIGHFHAADFYGRYGYCKGIPKDKHDFACRRIPQLINEHTSCVLTVSFRQQEFDTVAPPEWKKRFGSTHGVATQMVVGRSGIGLTSTNTADQLPTSLSLAMMTNTTTLRVTYDELAEGFRTLVDNYVATRYSARS